MTPTIIIITTYTSLGVLDMLVNQFLLALNSLYIHLHITLEYM